MAHDAPHLSCCLMVDEQALDEDPEAFENCEACPVAQHVDGLGDVNRRAWQLYRRCVSRFTMEAHLVADVFRRCTAELSQDDFEEALDRFEILFDATCPAKTDKREE